MAVILLAYDGSEDARRAIATAGSLMGGRAVVVYVHSDEPEGLTAAAPGVVAPIVATPSPEAQQREASRARKVVEQGRRLASEAGFEPEHELMQGAGARGIREAILSAADDWDAALIVVGRRGMGGLRAAVLGSVSDGVVAHASRPVLVVPPPADDSASEP